MSAPSTPETASILLVDDRPENLLALEAILEPLGQTLVRAASGDEALKALLTRDFAVILLDVQMPGLNGFETARLIKSRDRSKHIPIIFLTAISTEEVYVAKGYSVGAVDYISKPFHPEILRSKVSVFVDLYVKERQLERQAELLRESERRELELRHRARLRETEARLAEVVDSAMDAIIAFDGAQRITLFNRAAERMFGCKAKERIGESVARCFPDRFREEYLQRICSRAGTAVDLARDAPLARNGGGYGGGNGAAPQIETMTGLRGSDEEFPIEVTVSCLELPAGPTYTVIARDVTERLRAEEALRQQTESLAATTAKLRAANEELERAMGARSRFYAAMSHELRTPINAILGYIRLLLDDIYGPLNERQEESIQRTQKAAHHLLELVNDALDLSKIEAGKIELAIEAVRIPEIIDDLFVTVRPMADEHGCALTLTCEGGLGVVRTDPRRVRQILLNLLSNAIKYGEGKPITVTCRDREGGGVAVEVTDCGDGIPADELPRIFDEFVQVGKPRLKEGTGLGLPISKRLATLLGGSIEVSSEPGRGSTFRMLLPPAAPVPDVPCDNDVSDHLGDLQACADVRQPPSERPAEASRQPSAETHPDAQPR
jgi:signal transduction histidine kinase/DNA-binding response OmpR family regulator